MTGGSHGSSGHGSALRGVGRFRSHVEEKLSRLEKHDHRIIRVQVEVENERNPRQHDRAVRWS